MSKNEAKQDLSKVVLEKPHTHDGTLRPIGETIEVTAPERDWLQAQKIIKATAPKEAK